jgi:hypothetical protein
MWLVGKLSQLSQRTLSGSLLKYLSKLQVDEEPAIRTNTTILLGNIASYMNEGVCLNALLPLVISLTAVISLDMGHKCINHIAY